MELDQGLPEKPSTPPDFAAYGLGKLPDHQRGLAQGPLEAEADVAIHCAAELLLQVPGIDCKGPRNDWGGCWNW